MSEAPEEKVDPTIEEQEAELEAELKEAVEGQEADALEQEEKVDVSPEETVKVSLMELGMPEQRRLAAKAEIEIPGDVRSKDAISDLLVPYFSGAEPEAPEADAPEAPEVAEEAEVPEIDFRSAHQGQLAANAEVFRLLDELEGHGPTVRQFQNLSENIKALLPLT